MQSLLKRIERLEHAAKTLSYFSAECICFPQNEDPTFVFAIEVEIAKRLRCPLHGERFRPRAFIYASEWLREKRQAALWTHRSEQYRKAWFAGFPQHLWPAVEEENHDGQIFLVLKDGSRLLASEPPSAGPR
jgi:hypothetical protein